MDFSFHPGANVLLFYSWWDGSNLAGGSYDKGAINCDKLAANGMVAVTAGCPVSLHLLIRTFAPPNGKCLRRVVFVCCPFLHQQFLFLNFQSLPDCMRHHLLTSGVNGISKKSISSFFDWVHLLDGTAVTDLAGALHRDGMVNKQVWLESKCKYKQEAVQLTEQ